MTAGDQVEELDLEAIGNRAATGRNVSKYAQRQGLDDDFASAIEASYRDETDQAYS